jgi:hypothetical protein
MCPMAKCLQNGHRSAILGSEKKYFCTTSLYNKMNSHLKIFPVTIVDIHVKSDKTDRVQSYTGSPSTGTTRNKKQKTLEDQNKEKCKVQTSSLSLSN